MRLLKILFILLASIFFLVGNIFALNIHPRKDIYSSINDPIEFVDKHGTGNLDLNLVSLIQPSPSLFAYNKTNNIRGFTDDFNQNLVNIPEQNIKRGSSFNMNDEVLRVSEIPTNIPCNQTYNRS